MKSFGIFFEEKLAKDEHQVFWAGQAGEIETAFEDSRMCQCRHWLVWDDILWTKIVEPLPWMKRTVGQMGGVTEGHVNKSPLPSGFMWKASSVFASMNRRVLQLKEEMVHFSWKMREQEIPFLAHSAVCSMADHWHLSDRHETALMF